MTNRWIEFVKKWAKDNDTTYGCALSQPACKTEYQKKYGNRKKLTQKKEQEIMGAEDILSKKLKDYQSLEQANEVTKIEKKIKKKKKIPVELIIKEEEDENVPLNTIDFDKWIRKKLGFGWNGIKDKFGNWFSYKISPFNEQKLVRPNGKILDFSKDEDELTEEENKIYSKVFERIVAKLDNAFQKNGLKGIEKLKEDFVENSNFFSYLHKTIK